ncbi:2-oxoglutarate dehydrogenase complex dihydrolipoyllysine-residue succinyltransferase [Coxiella endosymbiont of Amblyomma americanum]|uniref:2-oxoglutarate dehydrogenase complex dihydrolipoyllysine-residue succinyltransferase n=1 Tax=Coxiella endosymbiont of Amblyomma americanum TaxID=325775 RepID=UPI0005803E12|nr:2-oxoglutarate dehydrogenase complex dihydrolipoyllysine-residue succinyltransferase [Coxiella endosymbiont of Amblyomma americanum]AJC50294.1 dihydrolipoamide succinyltransferase [Coxiella endosymbiont of Amblyomma americanum]AUJ58645.1 dihydrolipoamide succinyltransferase [Coxiella-like endosymbiont of Amblyomma americanum]
MSIIEIKVPLLPESVTDATIAKWYKQQGDVVSQNENLVDLETDKIALEVHAPKSGIIKKTVFKEGAVVKSGDVLVALEVSTIDAVVGLEEKKGTEDTIEVIEVKKPKTLNKREKKFGPSVRRLISREDLVGINKVLVENDKEKHITQKNAESYSDNQTDKYKEEQEIIREDIKKTRIEKRVPLSRIRQRIAERLVRIQQEAALLTTFNEINMQMVVDLRKKYCDEFEKKHKVRLGFMSFFAKASVEALKNFPLVNSSIDKNDIVYHDYYDIGIAIGAKRGLVVPILRNVENMSIVNIERKIREYAVRAQEGCLSIDELTGGTFTITNGGTYGSLLSTPIINLPQTAILGMHKIEDRPIVEQGRIVIRPIMLVALSYDHRIIDGREAILFLVTIKKLLENPFRLILEI